MTKYAQQWEGWISEIIEDGTVTEEDLAEHLMKISWLQHERLIHLLVMLFTAFILMMVFILILYRPGIWMGVLFVVMLILTAAYVHHYHYLENTVQRWYVLADNMKELLKHDR